MPLPSPSHLASMRRVSRSWVSAPRGGTHGVAAQEPDRVPHAAFPVARVRVAETHVHPATADERLEHPCQRHLAPGVPVAGAGRVVDHERARRAADMPEDRHEPPADAFRVLRGQARHVPLVRMRDTRPPGNGRRPIRRPGAPRPDRNPSARLPAPAPAPRTRRPARGSSAARHARSAAPSGYEPRNPCSATSRSCTRLAACRCLRGISRSSSNHPSITGLNSSSFDATTRLAGGRGEQSSMFAYLATAPRPTPSSLAIRAWGTPRAPRHLISCCLDTGTRHCPFLPRAGGNRPLGR